MQPAFEDDTQINPYDSWKGANFKLKIKLLCALDEHGYPELADRARYLNKRDKFVMKYDPVEIEKRERAEQQRKADNKRRKNE